MYNCITRARALGGVCPLNLVSTSQPPQNPSIPCSQALKVPGSPCSQSTKLPGLQSPGYPGPRLGSCWGYVGLSWTQVASKMAPDRFMLPQVGLKKPKMVPKGPQVPQDESKMASRWFPNRLFPTSSSFFCDFRK